MLKKWTGFGIGVSIMAGLLLQWPAQAQKKEAPVPLLRNGANGLMYEKDPQGNRIPDYSYCGYQLSEKEIPLVPNRIFIKAMDEDATATIQSAIDYVSGLKPDANGFRGAVLLDKGVFKVRGELEIRTSGVVLRGSGFGEGGTTLYATGLSREVLIDVQGVNDRVYGDTLSIVNEYVPVNAMTVKVTNAASVKPGDRITIRRPGTQQWIAQLGSGGDRPGNLDLCFDRIVTSVEGNNITFDVPLTNAIEKEYGGGQIIPYTWKGRINNVGVEFLNCISAFDAKNPKDENHAWFAILMQNVENAWVRQVEFKHFAGSAVFVQDGASRITVEDCIATEPVSEIGGYRRYTFYTTGQMTLFQRCYSEHGNHDFITGARTTGPNAFVQCVAFEPYGFSGALESWATGVLFDVSNVDGNALNYSNRERDGDGAGWTAANSMMWNCSASRIENYRPPTAQNWSFGCWATFAGNGYWHEQNSHINPRSIFYAQLSDRLKKNVSGQARIQNIGTEGSSSPTLVQAQAMTRAADGPRQTMQEWIELAELPQGALNTSGLKTAEYVRTEELPWINERPLAVKNGWIVRGNGVVTGRTQEVRWWNGSVKPTGLLVNGTYGATPHITRYVAGRTGLGLTDDLDVMTDQMQRRNVVVTDHNYGLWYDRRRDDHQRVRRMDGDVQAPFYELPFARSGEGTAWDGLSKYDLTRYNNWYWTRLRDYVRLGDQKGMILWQQHYFQHNIIEAGAHWADVPWRSANNVNTTGFPEPVPYAGDKRIFMAEQFYDITNEHRRELHAQFIRKCLDNFPENSGVIHSISAEFTGPFHFVKFWLETIKNWETETGRHALVALSTTKDVQDSVLADPALASVVDIIDIRYWFERNDGSFYEPQGGMNLAPRQHARIMKVGSPSFESVYNAVLRYRENNPGKAIVYYANGYPQFAWASFMAGGSLAAIPVVQDAGFVNAVSGMKPITSDTDGYLSLGDDNRNYIIYPKGTGQITLKAPAGQYEIVSIDMRNGAILSRKQIRDKSGVLSLDSSDRALLWVRRM